MRTKIFQNMSMELSEHEQRAKKLGKKNRIKHKNNYPADNILGSAQLGNYKKFLRYLLANDENEELLNELE